MKLKNSIKQLKNYHLPLKLRIEVTSWMILLLMLGASVLGLLIMYKNEQRLLYETIKKRENYSASVFSDNLLELESLTDFMIADSSVQNALNISATPSADNRKRSEAYQTLSLAIPGYYQNFKQNAIHYINLYTDNYAIYSNMTLCKKLKESAKDSLIQAANEKSGYSVWKTDYCQSQGLFLVRDIRRIDRLKLDRIGTVMINVNMDKLLEKSRKSVSDSDYAYILYDENYHEFFHTNTLSKNTIQNINTVASKKYGITHINGKTWFYVKGEIPDFDWSYVSLTDYSSISGALKQYLKMICLLFVMIILISLFLAQKLTHSVTKHFDILMDRMHSFGQNNKILPPAPYDYSKRKDEIGQLHQNFEHMVHQVQDLIEKNYVAELLTKEAQLKSLENQINPHFLYNTLESLNWQAKALGAKDISTMVESLGSLLRITLDRKNSSSDIYRELEIVKNYMSIIEIRFCDRVEFQSKIPSSMYHIPLPKLTLQPLVENAIHYALENMIDVCCIDVWAEESKDFLFIYVKNTGSQFPQNLLQRLNEGEIIPHGFGIGLLNINKRLQLLYGSQCGLSLYNDEIYETATVRICIPRLNV